MSTTTDFPYLAKATIKYKSPHQQDLTFAKGETIRVTGVAPKTDNDDEDDDDDDDWLIGESMDGSRKGTFPGSFVKRTDEPDPQATAAAGAIPSEAPTALQSTVSEDEPVHTADTIPPAARQAAEKGHTEEAGFGAPLPPRPPSPDEEEDQAAADEDSEQAPAAPTAQSKDSAPVSSETPQTSKLDPAASSGGALASATPAALNSTTSAQSPAPKTSAEQVSQSTPRSPPPVTTKPAGMSSSFRDRIAAFNKPAEAAPPPVPKGKPGAWKRPTPTSGETKPVLPGPTSATVGSGPKSPKPAPAAASPPPPSVEPSSGGAGGFSAADAQSSIKMSLKERMAALQRQEASASESAPEIKPKPAVPGKIGADRRNVALQGMGLAAPEPTRKATANDDVQESAAIAPEEDSKMEDAANLPTATDDGDVQPAQSATSGEEADRGIQGDHDQGQAESKELTEEEQEAERRAAIAKRMAALGARRMGGGPAVFGAPAPPTRTKTSTSVASAEETTTIEPAIVSPEDASNKSGQDAAASPMSPSSESTTQAPKSESAEEPKILAVPRRTAAPRKKRSPAPATAAVATSAAEETGGATELERDEDVPATAHEINPIPPEQATSQGLAASGAAAEAMSTSERAAAPATLEEDRDVHQRSIEPDALGSTTGPTAAENLAETPQEESDTEIAENQRQLEEYLRGEGFFEEPNTGIGLSKQESARDTVPVGTMDSGAEVSRDNVASPKPPSRPPSTRPPVPKTPVPVAPSANRDEDDSTYESPAATSASRRGSAIPPVPKTTLPAPPEEGPEASSEPISHDAAEEEATPSNGPVLAAPRPRMAVPTEDPEDEQILAAAQAHHPHEPQSEEAQEESAAAEEPEEPEELTEEQQEAQRRANLARRMAALGGQRIGGFPGMGPPPIMGAPMPARKVAAPPPEEEDGSNDARAHDAALSVEEPPLSPRRGPPRGGMAIPGLTAAPGMDAQQAEGEALVRAKSPGAASVEEQTPVRLASPPPIPKSPPPKPMSPPPPSRPIPSASEAASPPALPAGRPANTAPSMASLDEAVRMASPADSGSQGKRSSMKPPVPQGILPRSRDGSMVLDETDGSGVARGMTTSPPPLPVSPPPRPSSRAPPLPGQAAIPRRQASTASNRSVVIAPEVPSAASAPSRNATPASELPTSPSGAHQLDPSMPSAPMTASIVSTPSVGARQQSSRDLDLMPSSRWWRHGLNPLRLPPSVAGRPDAVLYADTSSSTTEDDRKVHRADIFLLFEDYSTTVISLSFQDDDVEEANTILDQRHNFPPPRPSAEMLKQWSSQIGASIAKVSSDAGKQASSPVADGSPRGFVQSMISTIPNVLPPVGASLGAVILTQAGPTVMEHGADEVRPGDIVSCSQADFRGKKGLAPYHMTFGTQAEPTTGVIIEVESKKNKLRCIIQHPNNKKGLPEEVSLRLDDLKSGIVKVYRVPPRQGWVQDW